MVDRQSINLPPSERPLNFQDFSYSSVRNKNQLFHEIAAAFSFTFGRRIPDSYLGNSYDITNNDEKELEARSFIDPAQRAWKKYGQNEERAGFVRQKLEQKWNDLKGEELTGIKLDLT